MLKLDSLKAALPQDITVGEAASFTRLTLPNGSFLADIKLETGALYASIDLLTAELDSLETDSDDLSMLIDGYEEAFQQDFWPAWKDAGFRLDCVEDASADANFVCITARVESDCPDVASVVRQVAYLREHMDDVAGTIAFM